MPRKLGDTTKKKIWRLQAEKEKPSAPRSLNQYDAATVSKAFQLFLLYNGTNAAQIVREMRKTGYSWFTETRLRTLVETYGWRESLKYKVEADAKTALTTADVFVDRLDYVEERLFAQLKGDGTLDKDTVNQYRDIARLRMDALLKVKAERDTLGGFKAFYLRLLNWLGDYSPHAVEALLQVEDSLLARAARELVNVESDETETSA